MHQLFRLCVSSAKNLKGILLLNEVLLAVLVSFPVQILQGTKSLDGRLRAVDGREIGYDLMRRFLIAEDCIMLAGDGAG